MLDSSALEVYNKVFSFLLKLKRATWAIEFIAGRGMIPDLSLHLSLSLSHTHSHTLSISPPICSQNPPPSPSSPVGRRGKSSRPALANQHRLQLLRFRMAHAVTSIHAYFMTRILHRWAQGKEGAPGSPTFIHRAALLTNHSAVARPPWVGLCSLLHAV